MWSVGSFSPSKYFRQESSDSDSLRSKSHHASQSSLIIYTDNYDYDYSGEEEHVDVEQEQVSFAPYLSFLLHQRQIMLNLI
jgi:hypothetical protein